MTIPEELQLDLLTQRRYVHALASELVFDPHLAQDIEQEVVLAALANGPHRAGALKGWLAALVRNLANKTWRSSQRRVAREQAVARPEGTVPSPGEILESEEQRKRLIELVLALAEPQRSVMMLRYFEELSPREVAHRLGLPLETVRTRLKRGLGILRERLDRESRGGRAVWCLALVRGLKLPASGAQVAGSAVSSLTGVVLMSLSKKVTLAVVALVLVTGAIYVGQAIGRVERPAQVPGDAAVRSTAELSEAARQESSSDSLRAPVESGAPLLESTTPAEGSLLLRVSWHDGAPASGIGAFVHSLSDRSMFERDMEVRTGAEGTCQIDHLQPGRISVRLDRDAAGVVDVEAGELVELALTIPHGNDLQGIVVETDGSPVAGAEIFVDHGYLLGHVIAHSGADGRFSIRSVSRGMCWLSARAPFHAPTPQVLVGGVGADKAPRTVEVRLVFVEPGGALEGNLLDSEANPVQDAQVLVGRETLPGPDQIRLPDGQDAYPPSAQRVAVDDQGRFHFAGVAPGRQPVWVRARGFAMWKGEVEILEGQLSRMEIVLLPGTTVEGRLRDVAGNAIAGLPIVLVGSPAFHHRSAVTADDGAYALHDLPAGEFELVVYRDGAPTSVSTRLIGSAGAVLRWDPVLGSYLVIRGRIVSKGLDLTLFMVQCMGRESEKGRFRTEMMQPDPSGRFEFQDRADVSHRIEVFSIETLSYPLAMLEEVRPSGDELVIEIDPGQWPSIRLKGRVLDASGQPLTWVRITPQSGAPQPSRALWETDADGAFDIGPYPPGRWRVLVLRMGMPTPLLVSDEVPVLANQTWDFGDLIVGG